MTAVDTQASSITIRTRAKGLLGRLAHDLEIRAASFAGDVHLDGARWTATLAVPVAALSVVGALKGDRVDPSVLSRGDVADIEQKIQRDVLLGREVVVAAEGEGERGSATVTAPRGEQRVALTIERDASSATPTAYGSLVLSLRALGVAEIKGPLGAFKVDDAIEVAFWIKLCE